MSFVRGMSVSPYAIRDVLASSWGARLETGCFFRKLTNLGPNPYFLS